jgi:hypothetical protein
MGDDVYNLFGDNWLQDSIDWWGNGTGGIASVNPYYFMEGSSGFVEPEPVNDPNAGLGDQTVTMTQAEYDALQAERTKIEQQRAAGQLSNADTKQAITELYQTFGVPFDPATGGYNGAFDNYGLVSNRIKVADYDTSGGGGVGGVPSGSSTPTSEPAGGNSGVPSGSSTPTSEPAGGNSGAPVGAEPNNNEHPWVYDAETGTMRDVRNPDSYVVIPPEDRGLFEDGGNYSAGDGAITAADGKQVAGYETQTDDTGNVIDFSIFGPAGNPDSYNTAAQGPNRPLGLISDAAGIAASNQPQNTGGSGTGTGSGSGTEGSGGGTGGSGVGGGTGSGSGTGGSGGGTGGSGVGGGSGTGTGTGTGSGGGTGDGPGDGPGDNFFGPGTEITAGMFGDFLNTERDPINTRLLTRLFRNV